MSAGLDFDQRRLELIAKLETKLIEERKRGSNMLHRIREVTRERDDAVRERDHLRSVVETLESELLDARVAAAPDTASPWWEGWA